LGKKNLPLKPRMFFPGKRITHSVGLMAIGKGPKCDLRPFWGRGVVRAVLTGASASWIRPWWACSLHCLRDCRGGIHRILFSPRCNRAAAAPLLAGCIVFLNMLSAGPDACATRQGTHIGFVAKCVALGLPAGFGTRPSRCSGSSLMGVSTSPSVERLPLADSTLARFVQGVPGA